MNIIIVGQGKVGSTLSSQLSAEGHEIVMVDTDDGVLHLLQEKLDAATLCGNGAAAAVLEEAGAAHADLLIACTNGDELNLLSCMAARKLGTKNTIARVRNPEYDSNLRLLKDEFHISLSVNPELTAAREIYRILQYPAFLRRETFLRDKAEVVELRVAPDSPLDGLKLMELPGLTEEKALICAVERQGKITVPKGDFMLMAQDRISIVAQASGLVRLLKDLKIPAPRIRSVMIVGGSRIAQHVAGMLLKSKVRVTIIENDKDRCLELTAALPEATIICGNGTLQELLVAEGVGDMDALLALTGIDEENLTISLFANYLKVPKTVTKINRTEYLDVYNKAGVDTIISPKLLTANEIVRYVRAMGSRSGESMIALSRIMEGRAEAMEFAVPPKALYCNIPFKSLPCRKDALIAAIARGKELLIPSGNDVLKEDDRVVAVAPRNASISDLGHVFIGGGA